MHQSVAMTIPILFALSIGAGQTLYAQNIEDEDFGLWESSVEISEEGEDLSSEVDIDDIIEQPSEYHYSSFSNPDPFVPSYRDGGRTQQTQSRSYEIPVVSGLQVTLSRLTVIGIWRLATGERRALIQVSAGQNSKGEGIIAKVGDPIGPSGKITKILQYGIMHRQYRLTADGTRLYDDDMLWLGNQDSASKDTPWILEPGQEPRLKENVASSQSSLQSNSRLQASDKNANPRSNKPRTPKILKTKTTDFYSNRRAGLTGNQGSQNRPQTPASTTVP